MKLTTFFVILALLVVCVVGLGFYQGWFVLSSSETEKGSNKRDVKLTVDPDKAKADAEAVKAKAKDLTGNSAEKTPAKNSDDGAKTGDGAKTDEGAKTKVK